MAAEVVSAVRGVEHDHEAGAGVQERQAERGGEAPGGRAGGGRTG